MNIRDRLLMSVADMLQLLREATYQHADIEYGNRFDEEFRRFREIVESEEFREIRDSGNNKSTGAK